MPRISAPRDDSFWEGDNVPGSPSLRINLSEQRVYFYKGGHLVGMSPISSGREGYGTTAGKFYISEKDLDHKSSWYGEYITPEGDIVMHEVDNRKDACPPGAKFDGANMRYFMRINGPIGMHEGYLPGYAASHGCIRLPSHMAAAFYEATPLGTPVVIVR
ncbi:MAG: L,D-transpeptidase family protein [Prosthecobacter sp.]|nr:L,D-transpeptidase family protein [Prosthecobacter sp.]